MSLASSTKFVLHAVVKLFCYCIFSCALLRWLRCIFCLLFGLRRAPRSCSKTLCIFTALKALLWGPKEGYGSTVWGSFSLSHGGHSGKNLVFVRFVPHFGLSAIHDSFFASCFVQNTGFWSPRDTCLVCFSVVFFRICFWLAGKNVSCAKTMPRCILLGTKLNRAWLPRSFAVVYCARLVRFQETSGCIIGLTKHCLCPI